MEKNPVCFWELASHDAEKSVAFLRELFAWDLSFDDCLGFYTMDAGELNRAFSGGGCSPCARPGCPS